jgi:hypothetical protein
MAVAARGFWAATAAVALLFLGALQFNELFGDGPALVGILFLITVALGRHNLALHVANAQSEYVRYGLLSWAKNGVDLFAGFIFIYHGNAGRGALLGFLAGLILAVIAFAPRPWIMIKISSDDTQLSAQMFHYVVCP